MVATRARRHASVAQLAPLSSRDKTERGKSVVETAAVKMEPLFHPLSQAERQNRSGTTAHENIAIENIGRGVKELVQAINKIEQLGITKVAGHTPKIVIIGDQSTGKSSVISAISGIQVPRSSGTCTRCPMQITLTENRAPKARWRCDISLRIEFFYNPNRDSSGPTEKLPLFFPWEEYDQPNTIHFKTVHDKKELHNVIFQAQSATLNPGSDPTTFASMEPLADTSGAYEVDFSPNLVCLDISAPGLPNLSFYDLPGVISQTEHSGDLALIKLVKQLVRRYVSKENALVLLACSMENDIQNSSSAGLLRKYGANDRCLGILTKPDRLPRGDPVDRWESILKGQAFQLGHGYHVVRNPSQAELDKSMDHTTARRMETDWFSSREPWCRRFAPFSHRFGTEKLQEKLSQMLAIQILQCLPLIHSRVQEQMTKIDTELAHLPEPPTTDALHIVLDIINGFTDKIARQMEGKHPDNQFRLIWKELRTQFLERIRAQKPTMLVKTASESKEAQRHRALSAIPQSQGQQQTTPSQHRDVISIDSDNDNPQNIMFTPRKKRKLASDGTCSQRGASGEEYTGKYDLDYIRSSLDNMSASDIPGEIDPGAVNHLRLLTFQGWEAPTNVFLDGIYAAARSTLDRAMDSTMRPWKTTELSREMARLSDCLLLEAFDEQRHVAVPRALRHERHKPFTENATALETEEKKELDVLQNARIQARMSLYFDKQDAITGKQTGRLDRQRRANDANFRALLGPDPYAREIEVMAKIRGYYNFASMRFIDNVLMGVQGDMFEQLRTGLKTPIITALGIIGSNSQDACANLLAEDAPREQRRRTLRQDRDKLVAALDCLQQLDHKYQQGISTAGASMSSGVDGPNARVPGTLPTPATDHCDVEVVGHV